MMRPLPGCVVRQLTKSLHIEWATWKGKHWNWLAYPDATRLELFLPAVDFSFVVLVSQNQICLYPWDPLTSVDQQLADPASIYAAVLV